MNGVILFVGNTTYDMLAALKQDITSSAINELTFLGQTFGGKAANAAVHCASLGAEAAYIGTVGNDFANIGYQNYLEQSCVDVSNVFYLSQQTPRFFAFHTEMQEYWFVTHVHTENDMHERFQRHLRSVILKSFAKVVYCALSSEETILATFECAKASGLQTAWNPIARFPQRTLVEQILRQTDLLFVNEHELAVLEESIALSVLDFYAAYRVSIICITLGANGCRLIEKGTVTDIPAMQVNVVNTVGAGDAFAGTFLATYLLFDSPVMCAELACIAGSLLVQSPRNQIEKPTLDQLLSLRMASC